VTVSKLGQRMNLLGCARLAWEFAPTAKLRI
jgi:hypothetical protein